MNRARIAAAIAAVGIASGALPAAAGAAGAVTTSAAGDKVTYTGDGAANVVTAKTSPLGAIEFTIEFAETGITEGADTKDLCKPAPNLVRCTIDRTKTITLTGEGGDDQLTLNSEELRATLVGGPGSDTLIGGEGDDSLSGLDDGDSLDGRGGADQLTGGAGADAVRGGNGDDYLLREDTGTDVVDLGEGNDIFDVANDDGNDSLVGGPGVDALFFTSVGDQNARPHATVDLSRGTASWEAFAPHPAASDSLTGIEDAGHDGPVDGDDTVIGDGGPNVLLGGAGNDTIVGGAGTDTIHGDKSWAARDHINQFYKTGSDTIDAADGFGDRIDCGDLTDSLTADQFDGPLTNACENVDTRTIDPFGVPAPQPTTPTPTTPGGQQPEPQPARDVTAPVCTPGKVRAIKRRDLLRRGLSLGVTCDERARLDVSASQGKLVLATKRNIDAAFTRRLRFSIPGQLRKVLAKKFTVRVRVDATDASGNRATKFVNVKVR
jgi:hypothetical protein